MRPIRYTMMNFEAITPEGWQAFAAARQQQRDLAAMEAVSAMIRALPETMSCPSEEQGDAEA
jgi:hypothetical protein